MAQTIGKAANELGVSIETIRYYERRGIIKQPPKPSEGYREYPDTTINRIRFIKRAQEIGFSLSEIESLLDIDNMQCNKVEGIAQHKLESIKAKIRDLRKLEKALKQVLLECQVNQDKTHCPVLGSLQL